MLFTSESVTEGHPDKMADQISDAILDAILAKDKRARVAVETLLTNGICFIAGEVTTKSYADIAEIARKVIRDIGYSGCGFHYQTCGVAIAIKEQSSDIAQGVDNFQKAQNGSAQRGPRKPRCRRSGPNVWFCLPRNTGADASADSFVTSPLPTIGRGTQKRNYQRSAARRKISSHH